MADEMCPEDITKWYGFRAVPPRGHSKESPMTDRESILYDLVPTEEELVREWETEQFKKLGFGPHITEIMVDAKIDHHDAAKLVGAGCPVDTAVRILL